MSGKADAAPVRPRHYTPKEAASALEEFRIFVCARTISDRCALPAGHARHIATNPHWHPRHFIPESEVLRLAGITVEVTA
jgi:hypothetical protein